MVERPRVALLFGGRSAEHDVSVLSAANVFRALDPARYDFVPIGITRSGTWVLCPVEDGEFPAAVPESGPRAALVPGGAGQLASCRRQTTSRPLSLAVDVVFPVLHGPSARTERSRAGRDRRGRLCRLRSHGVGRGDGQGCRQAPDARRRPADRALCELHLQRRAAFDLRLGIWPSPVRQAAGSARRSASARPGRGRNSSKGRRGVPARPQDPGRGICPRPRDRCGVFEGEDGSLTASPPGEIVPSNRHGSTPTKNTSTSMAPRSKSRPTCRATSETKSEAVDRGLPRARLRRPGAHRLFPARGRQAPRQRGQHPAGLHQHQHVPQAMEATGSAIPSSSTASSATRSPALAEPGTRERRVILKRPRAINRESRPFPFPSDRFG